MKRCILLIRVLFCTSVAIALGATQLAAQNFAYVANSSSNNVSVIDTATYNLVTTIPIANTPADVTMSPDGKHAYVASQSGTISVIDTATNTVSANFNVGGAPFNIVLTADGSRAYVVNPGCSEITVVDIGTGNLINTISLSYFPLELILSPDGSHAYITTYGKVLVLDTFSNQITATVPVGNYPFGLAISSDGKHLYIGDTTASLWVMDTTNYSIAAVSGAFGVQKLAITPDGSRLFAAEAYGYVAVFDTTQNKLVDKIYIAQSANTSPYGVAVSSDGKHAYVTDLTAGQAVIIDTTTSAVVARTTVGNYPEGVAIMPMPPVPRNPAQQISDLILLVNTFNAKQGIQNSLDAKLTNAEAALTAANANNRSDVCNLMAAFMNEASAQSGKALTVDQAAQLLTSSSQIRSALACQ